MTGSEPARSSPSEPTVPDRVDALLVPLDGSDFSQVAVPVAARLAASLGAEIHLLSAVESADAVERRARELVNVQVPGHVVHRAVVIDRDPADAIHQALRKLDHAVACMATHGGARSAALVGSVATDVVARCRDPLVLVCPYMAQEQHGSGVVACVDDSPAAASLVSVGLRWADLLGERCVVLTVAEEAPEPVSGGPRPPPVRARWRCREVPRHARRAVPGGRPHDRGRGSLRPDQRVERAVPHLHDHPAALVGTNTRSWTGVRRLAFGSVATSIVRHSPSPVLVVPRADRGSPP